VPFLFTIFTAPFSGLPGIVYAMSVAAFVNAVGRMGMLFVALYLAEVQHYGAGSIGWLVAAAGLGSVTGAYASGVLSDRLPPAHVLVAALALTAASFALLILAAGPWMIAPILFLVGLGEGGFRPPYNRIVMAACSPEDWARAHSVYRMAVNLAFAVAGPIGGLLASVDYVLVFATDGLTSILAAGLMLWMFGSRSRLGRRTAEHPLAHETILVAKRSPYKDLVFGALCLSLLLSSLVLDQVKSTYPLYLNEVYRLEPEEIGSLYLINGLMVVAMQVPLTWLLKHVASQTTAWAGTLLLCGGFAVLPFGSSFSLAILSLAIWTLGEILLYPPLIAIVMRRAEQGRSGEYLGIYHGASSLALLLGPAIGGTIYAVWSPATLWFGCGVIGILAAMLIAIPESRLSWAAGRTRVGAPD
jgi:predicted MFS family arabinose efflux permease